MITQTQIQELREDPTLVAIYDGIVMDELNLPVLYDHDYTFLDGDVPEAIMLEVGDSVIVTEHLEGLYFLHFLSWAPKRYHYKLPWTTDDQVTHNGEAVYHV